MFGHYLSHIITSNYLEVDYGYALTVHKSQGSTYDDVFIEYNNLQANKKDTEKYKLLYTAITRSANKIHIYH
jgi:exodeoxyribonuclease-5